MRVCVFGAGALGSAIGGLLSRQNEVTLVGRKEHMTAVRRSGLLLSGDDRRRAFPSAVESIAEAKPAELLLVTTKAYDTGEAVEECRGWAAPETVVLTLQNGLGNLELLRAWKGRRAFGGTTSMGATFLSPGKVRISGFGRTVIGSDEDAAGAGRIARMFQNSGLPASTVRDVWREIWSKAAVSSCINPTTAILRVRNGLLFETSWSAKLIDAVLRECATIAAEAGISLSYDALRRRVRGVARDTGQNLSSMLQDVMRGKRTEIGQINGEFARRGEERGIDVPFNTMLTAVLESMQTPRPAKG